MKNNINGFTLIEAMVAILLTGLLALIFAAAFPTGQAIIQKGELVSIATDIAQEKMEELRKAGYNSLTFGTQTFQVSQLPNGQGKITISPYPTSTSPNLAKVDIEISWQGAKTTSGKVKISSLISLYY
jgi:prepilin-type N-terminal cleavage/methylation domain-containing protein